MLDFKKVKSISENTRKNIQIDMKTLHDNFDSKDNKKNHQKLTKELMVSILENIEYILTYNILKMDSLLDIVDRYPTFFEDLAKSKDPHQYLTSLPYSF